MDGLMIMSKLEKITSYRVDGNVFETKEDAEHYLVEKKIQSVRNDPTYKNTEFHNTSYYEHYIYEGASHEFCTCVGIFTTLEEALDNMSFHRNTIGEYGSGYIQFVTIKENEDAHGLVEIERKTVIDVR